MQKLDGSLVLSASDLVGYLACAHLTVLEREAAEGLRRRPVRVDPALDVIQKRGFEREARFLAAQREAGRTIVEFASDPPRGREALREADGRTLEAMLSGADVIAQAAFFDGDWQGRADFLLRVEEPSLLGPWSYEPADAKLSRIVKGAAIVQLSLYADQLRRLQGTAPRLLHVITGDGRTHSCRREDFAAYFRRVRRAFLDGLAGDARRDTYPEPVDHCRVCRWWMECADRRRADDHLSLVAGLTRAQTAALRTGGVPTRTALGRRPADAPPIQGLRPQALDALRAQAHLQLAQEADGVVRYELIPPAGEGATRGLHALPAPSPGDVFLDLEAHPWAADEGLEYLFGILTAEGERPDYRPVWAHSADEERRAFDGFMALVQERLGRWPDLHVYHYGGYESGALKRLMGRHALREEELDALLRGGVLVDLYSIVRQGVRVSQETYSLKAVEKLYLEGREGPVTRPGYALLAYEEWLESRRPEVLDAIAAYNRDDCVSLWRLRAWLEERRIEAAARFGGEWPRPPAAGASASEKVTAALAESAHRSTRLRAGIPVEPAARTGEERARWLLSCLLEFHRREDKPQWWRYFYLRARPIEELVEAPDALGALEYEGVVGTDKQSLVHRYRHDPEQEHPFKLGDKPVDPALEGTAGTVVAVDRALGTIDLKRSRTSAREHPRALVKPGPTDASRLRAALGRVADHVIAHGMEGPGAYRAVRDLLLRQPPRLTGGPLAGPLARPDGDEMARAREIAVRLDESCLPIQGPPGSGKTYTGARMVLSLLRQGRRVGVTATAHKAIVNMLQAIGAAARAEGVPLSVVQKADEDQAAPLDCVETVDKIPEVAKALVSGRCAVAAGTAWLFAAPEMEGLVDVLFVDEAGQMALATAIAAGTAARSIVLLGDPNQLPQVTQGTHPEGAGRSALEHVLGDDVILPPEKGLFLSETRRLHPDLCRYVSEAFYASRLLPHPVTHGQRVGPGSRLGEGAGLVFVPVVHDHRAARSPEEARLAAEIVKELLGCRWTDHEGLERRLARDDILLVAPYNVQVAELTRAVETTLGFTPNAGTVDKFQGQEGAVVLYSMTTSSPDDAPRHLDFLYSRNRLNVAVSRARCFAVVLGSARLFDVPCKTPELMRALNAFCQLLEGASAAPRPGAAVIALGGSAGV